MVYRIIRLKILKRQVRQNRLLTERKRAPAADRTTPYNRNSAPDQHKNGKIRFGSEALGKGAVKNKTGFSKPELFGGSSVKPDDVSEPKPVNKLDNKEDSKNEQIST